MIDILKFIVSFCYKLFEVYKFKFIDSSVSGGMGSSGWILLESENVQFYFSRERDEIFLEVKSNYDTRQKKWYSFDLIRGLLTKESFHHGIMDSDNGKFLEDNIEAIMVLFVKERYVDTLAELDKVKKERSKKI